MSTAASDRRYLGVADAARDCSVSPGTIRKLIRDGRLEAHRLGRRLLIEPSALDRWADDGGRHAADHHNRDLKHDDQ